MLDDDYLLAVEERRVGPEGRDSVAVPGAWTEGTVTGFPGGWRGRVTTGETDGAS